MKVTTDSHAGSYIVLPATQLSEVRRVLDRACVRYWADAMAVSVDGKPAMTVINLGKESDAQHVQAILDSAA